MRSLAKQSLLGSLICSLLLCTSSNAAPTATADDTAFDKQFNYVFFSPQVFSEGYKNTSLFTSSQQYSLLLTADVNKPSYKSCGKKKNELYELSAIISDKLHVFLSYFDDKPQYQFADKIENKDSSPIEG